MANAAPFRQRIVVAKPPVWDRCVATFGYAQVARKGIIFSWGDRIYNPSNVSISRPLLAHEAVHGERHGTTEAEIWHWWEQYLTDRQFRLEEELLAHRAEYQATVRRHGHSPQHLRAVAGRLASPLYGGIIKAEEAKHAILTGALP